MYFTKYVLESYLHISSLISSIYYSLSCAEYRMTKKYVFLHVFCQQVRRGCNLPLRVNSFANKTQQQQKHFFLANQEQTDSNQYSLNKS